MEHRKDSSSQATERYLNSQGFNSIMHMSGGHTEALLYRANQGLERKVIKIGSLSGANDEVDANRAGYESIQSEGAGSIIPSGLSYGEFDGRRFIVMPDLGVDLAQQDRNGELKVDDYEAFVRYLNKVVSDSVSKNNSGKAHMAGLKSVYSQIKYWLERLVDQGVLGVDDSNYLLEFEVDPLATNKTSVMIMDFTPDNIFLNSDGISFIDPWLQDTYRGSFVPSMSQFTTLATDVYGLPLAKTVKARAQFEIAIDKLGGLLDLTPRQIHAQTMMGKALQYLLSGYVRLESDTELARMYILEARKSISLLKDDIIRIKGD